MGIDIHLGDHYVALFHLPAPVALLLAAVGIYLAVKLGRFLLALTGFWSN